MKSFDSRTYSINDFVEWEAAGQLELNPNFQRRPVWSDKAKSYLLDTIIRGKPMPKIFIRQKINVSTKKSVREVVDGQQRLRAILSFIKNGFVISKRHNNEFGGIKFSELDETIQENILAYEVAVDLLINLPDSEILDIFGRLNAYAVTLNEQEKINADHFGPFKVLADEIGRKYYEYWLHQEILTQKQMVRMLEVNLVADLLIALLVGIKSKKQIKKYYDQFESNPELDTEILSSKFDRTINRINSIFPEGLGDTEFRRPHIFYSLFTAIAHLEFGIPNIPQSDDVLSSTPDAAMRNRLEIVEFIFDEKNAKELTDDQKQFLEDSRRATTDESVRIRRAKYLIKLISDN